MAPARRNKFGELRAPQGKPQQAVPQSKPKGKAAPRPKAKAKGQKAKVSDAKMVPAMVMHAAGAHPFDPTHLGVPPSLLSIPRVFPVNGTVRTTFDTIATERTAFFVSGWGGGATIAYRVTISGAGLVVPEAFTVPLLSQSSSAGGPTSSKISKVGFRLSNATPALNRGGRAYMVRLDQRIKFPSAPSGLIGSQWNTIFTTLNSLPDDLARPVDLLTFGADYKGGQKAHFCIVDDEVDYQVFENHLGSTSSMDEWFSHIGVWSGAGISELQRPMSILVLILESPANTGVNQQLTLNFDAQWLTRWPVDTIPGQAAGTIKASSHAVVDLSRTKAEATR